MVIIPAGIPLYSITIIVVNATDRVYKTCIATAVYVRRAPPVGIFPNRMVDAVNVTIGVYVIRITATTARRAKFDFYLDSDFARSNLYPHG